MRALIATNVCYGVTQPSCWLYNTIEAHQTLNNIAEASKSFGFCFFVNDLHYPDDPEFRYIPSHMIFGSPDVARLDWFEKKIRSYKFQFRTKNALSALRGNGLGHELKMYGFDEIALAGFTASIDVLATALDLLQEGHKVFIIKDCIDDTKMEHKIHAVTYLKYLGIPVC